MRAALRAGESAATEAATTAVATIAPSCHHGTWYGATSRSTRCTRSGRAPASTAPATTTPTSPPMSPLNEPWRSRLRRTTPAGAPFALSWPIVVSWRRALVANAAVTMTPNAASASTPATKPQASSEASFGGDPGSVTVAMVIETSPARP